MTYEGPMEAPVIRPWWATDLRELGAHLWEWASEYAAAAIGAATTLQLMLPQVEEVVDRRTFGIIKIALVILILLKAIRDARRPQNQRSADKPSGGPQ